MMRKSFSQGILPLTMILTGCTMAPDYHRPALPVAAH